MANWKVDIGGGSQAFGQSLLASAQKRSKKRRKKAKIAGYAALALGIGDMVMQRRANSRLEHLKRTNTVAEAAALANFKQASSFYDLQVKDMITKGINVNDVREGGDVHNYLRHLEMERINRAEGITSTMQNADPSIMEQIRSQATIQSADNLREYQKKYAKYGQYIDDGVLVSEEKIKAPYEKILIDATNRLTSPDNTSIIRAGLNKIGITKSNEDLYTDIKLGGDTFKVSYETAEAFRDRVQMSTDQSKALDDLIAQSTEQYGPVKALELKRAIVIDEPDNAREVKIYASSFKAVENQVMDTSGIDAKYIKDGKIDWNQVQADGIDIKLNSGFLAEVSTEAYNGVSDGDKALSKAELEMVFENLTSVEVNNFRTSVFNSLKLLEREAFNIAATPNDPNPIIDITPEMMAQAINETIRENFIFTKEEGDQRVFDTAWRDKNNLYVSKFNVISDTEKALMRKSKEEQQQFIQQKLEGLEEKERTMAEALMAMDPVAITNDFKKNMEEGQSLSELNRMRDLIKEYRPELEDEVDNIMADYAPPPPPQIEEIEVTATRRQMDEILETPTTPTTPEIEEIEVTAEKRPEIEPEVVATPKKKRKTETKAEGKARRAREKAERKAKEKEIIGNVGSLLERVVPAVLSSIDQTRIEKLEKAIAKEQYGPVGSLIKKHTGTAYRKLSMEERKLAAEDIIKAILKGE